MDAPSSTPNPLASVLPRITAQGTLLGFPALRVPELDPQANLEPIVPYPEPDDEDVVQRLPRPGAQAHAAQALRIEPRAPRIEPRAPRIEPRAARIEPCAARIEPRAPRIEPQPETPSDTPSDELIILPMRNRDEGERRFFRFLAVAVAVALVVSLGLRIVL